MRGDSTVSDPTSTRVQSGICCQIHRSKGAIRHLYRTSLKVIQLLLGDDQTFVVRSIALVGAIRHIRRASPLAIQLLLEDDRAFVVRSTVLIEQSDIYVVLRRRRFNIYWGTIKHLLSDLSSTVLVGAIRHLCRALPSAIQLLLEDDRVFAVRSTVLIGRSDIFVVLHHQRFNFYLGDDRTFVIGSNSLVETIRHLRHASPSAIQLLLGDDWAFVVRSTVLTFAVRFTALVRAIRHLCRDKGEATSSSPFGEIEVKLYRRHLREGCKVALSTSSWKGKDGVVPSLSS
ncbi:hypothetical protein E6C27_scaffold638G00550 [Cucumis melo var. makuwa]|uniref:Uncharacterized protein n=1 Tax=Cucumis melo var. makuwa TaxID=1194695 RepID=A0A5A7VJB7_CUCMM|nr:hypothetical protein E6C27_scaffold638G00550 [Cucumis melo var. makuwa]